MDVVTNFASADRNANVVEFLSQTVSADPYLATLRWLDCSEIDFGMHPRLRSQPAFVRDRQNVQSHCSFSPTLLSIDVRREILPGAEAWVDS